MDSKLNSGLNPNYSTLSHPWFKTKWFKIILTALGVVAVVLVVLFNQQIGDLLRFFGSKAALEIQTLTLGGTTDINNSDHFLFNNEYKSEIWNETLGDFELDMNAVKVDSNGRLMINQ